MAESYKIGEKTAQIVLEIMNLDKKEVMPIYEISDQEFSEVIRHPISLDMHIFLFKIVNFFVFTEDPVRLCMQSSCDF